MLLAQLFFQHADRAVSAASVSHEKLRDTLWQLFESGRASWPQLEVRPEEFVLFLAKQLPPEATVPEQLLALRAGDLYLVCALGLGQPMALAAFETEYMPEVRRTLLRLDIPDSMISDIIQALYCHLLERQNAPQGVIVPRRGYAGRGELKGWLCACAVHQAGRIHKRDRREVALDQASALVLPAESNRTELALLAEEMKQLFESAFRDAVATLTSRERNLLRYHFLSGLSIDQIGTLYNVHRATAARWVVQARERLASLTRKRFLLAAPMHAESFAKIMELIRSQLSLNLANLLKQVKTDDPTTVEGAPESPRNLIFSAGGEVRSGGDVGGKP